MLPGEVHNLRHFGFSNLVGENAAFADPMLVHVHHDALRTLVVLMEETLEHVHDEFHRRVVVIEQKDAIEVRPLSLRSRLSDDRSPRPSLIAFALAIVVGHAGYDWRGVVIQWHFSTIVQASSFCLCVGCRTAAALRTPDKL
jgi:hypothetical protein